MDQSPSQVEALVSTISQLLVRNQINISNAFQIPLIDVHKMVGAGWHESENWSHMVAALESSYRVYGCRVDCMQEIVGRVMVSIGRTQAQHGARGETRAVQSNKVGAEGDVECHLDRHRLASEGARIDKGMVYNGRVRRIFDQQGLQGLILASLPLTSLSFSLEGPDHTAPMPLIKDDPTPKRLPQMPRLDLSLNQIYAQVHALKQQVSFFPSQPTIPYEFQQSCFLNQTDYPSLHHTAETASYFEPTLDSSRGWYGEESKVATFLSLPKRKKITKAAPSRGNRKYQRWQQPTVLFDGPESELARSSVFLKQPRRHPRVDKDEPSCNLTSAIDIRSRLMQQGDSLIFNDPRLVTVQDSSPAVHEQQTTLVPQAPDYPCALSQPSQSTLVPRGCGAHSLKENKQELLGLLEGCCSMSFSQLHGLHLQISEGSSQCLDLLSVLELTNQLNFMLSQDSHHDFHIAK